MGVYTRRAFKNGKEIREAFKRGERIEVWQPGPFGPMVNDGHEVIEGPPYPRPHSFYVGVVVKDNVVVRVLK